MLYAIRLLLCKSLFFDQVFSVNSPERQLLLVEAPCRFKVYFFCQWDCFLLLFPALVYLFSLFPGLFQEKFSGDKKERLWPLFKPPLYQKQFHPLHNRQGFLFPTTLPLFCLEF